ncbi:MAG: envelope integrity protein Cei [Pseudonocardia sp.]
MGARPYERRRHRPVVALASVLAFVAAVTWTVVLATAGGSTPTSCPDPPGGDAPGEVLDLDALDATAPAPVAAVAVRVLNAGGQRGQANLVAAQLGDLDIAEAAPPGNDPLHPDGAMECIGQLRFGPQGDAAAATLALVLPCTEPVRDGRPGADVDVVVGTEFRGVDPSRAVRDALDELTNPAADAGTVVGPDAAPAGGPFAPEVLLAARGTVC